MSEEPPNSPHDSVTRRASNAPFNFSSEQFVLEDAAAPAMTYSNFHAICLIATLTGIMFAGSMSTGLLTVGLPRIPVDVKLQENLLLWYVMGSQLSYALSIFGHPVYPESLKETSVL